MDSDISDADSDEYLSENVKELENKRSGTIFLIDGTKQSFVLDSSEGSPYFKLYIQKYKELLKEKLIWNKMDWMGISIFGTKKWNKDPETKHVLTLQEYSIVTRQKLKDAMMLENTWENYKDIAHSTEYPLFNALEHAIHSFSSAVGSIAIRRIILLSPCDNPPINDKEKHRIRAQVAHFKDLEIRLYALGLNAKWDCELFYKDLEMVANCINEEDYEPTSFEKLAVQIQRPSKGVARIPWRFSEKVVLDVKISTICVKSQYFKEMKLEKTTNKPVYSVRYWAKKDTSHDSDDEGETQDIGNASNVPEYKCRKMQTYGGKNIYFTPNEIVYMNNISKPGLHTICVKPIFIDVMYHFHTAYFVRCAQSQRKDNELLFGTLLQQCDLKDYMIVCSATLRRNSPPKLYVMIPNWDKGGFYLYKIPAKENVRDLNDYLNAKVSYDKNNPTNEDGVALLSKVIQKMKINYHPSLFPNPKLKVQQQNIETLALDLERGTSPIDDTLPKRDMLEKVNEMLEIYAARNHMELEMEEDTSSSVVSKKRKLDTEVDELIQNDQLHKCTLPQLKDILRKAGQKVGGQKAELIERIKNMPR